MLEKANLNFINVVDGMIKLDRPFGIASSAGSRSLELCNLTICSTAVETGFTLTVINGRGFWVGCSVCPGILAIDWRRTFLLRRDSGRHGLAGSCRRCTQRSCYLDGIGIQRVIGALDAISRREEGIESLDEVWISAE